jgi:DNA-directed RNA polymerase
MKIGDQLFHSWALEQYDKIYLISKTKNRLIYQKDIEKFKDFKINLNISPVHKGNLGEYLLHELVNMGSLLESEVVSIENSKKDEMRIKPSNVTLKLFEKSFEIVGFKLPMVCEPTSWSDDNDGGYLLNNIYHFDNIIHQGFKNLNPTTIVDKNNIYGQINYMSKIPFKINKDVLNYILEKGVEMKLILGSLHEKTDIQDKLDSFEKQEVISHNSRYFQEKNILGIAQLFKNVDKIYFPLFFDWRGRIYSNTSYLHYQSLSLAKALIQFANGDKLIESIRDTDENDSLYWLNVYGANCFGKGAKNLDEYKFGKYPFKSNLDKLSFFDRVNWIKLNHENIMNLDKDFWLKADEPLLFLAFCFEYKNLNTNKLYTSHLPLQLDATCNGLQHLSIMSANQNLARLVNILPNTKDQNPFDLYGVALVLIKEKINDLIIKDPLYINLKFLNIDRSIVKRSIMTIPYNVTVTGIAEHLKEFFHKKYIDGNYLYLPRNEAHGTKLITGKDLFKLAKVIHSTLYDTHPELQEVVNYFKEMVNLMTKLNLPIVWITPAGLEIKQRYVRRNSTRIRSSSFKGASYYIVIPTDKINKVSQESAFMPNLIHSMDASTITLLVKKLRFLGIYNLYTIHDCFATTANNISLVNELVRDSFCEIYANDDFLINLHKFFIEYIKGNFKVLYNYNYINEDSVISKEMITKGKLHIIYKGNTIEIPNLPKIGEFKNLKESIKKAIYLIN